MIMCADYQMCRLLLWLRRAIIYGYANRSGPHNHSVGGGLLREYDTQLQGQLP